MFRRKSLTEELTFYFKKNLKKGYTKESLRWALIEQGYSRIEVDKALKRIDIELGMEAPVLKTKPEIEIKVIPPEAEKKSFWQKLKDFFR